MARLVKERPSRGIAYAAGESGEDYVTRVAKYIPGEIVAGYIAVIALVEAVAPTAKPTTTSLILGFIVFVVGWASTPLYLWKIGKPTGQQWYHLVISSVAFPLWAYVLGGPFRSLQDVAGLPYSQPVGAVFVGLYSWMVGLFAPTAVVNLADSGAATGQYPAEKVTSTKSNTTPNVTERSAVMGERKELGVHDVILACIAQKAEAAIGGAAIDCADLALASLAQCCEDNNVRLSLEVYDSDTGAYIRIKRRDYASVDEYIRTIKIKMGAISLFDQDKVTVPKDLSALVPGDLILYQLSGNPDFTGHTMVVLTNDASGQEVEVAEGHTGSGSPTRGTYAYTALPGLFGDTSQFKGGREWKWRNIEDLA